MQSQFYTSLDGIACHYLFWPNTNSDSVCLLLHGFTNDAHIWDYLAPQLQKKYNVVALDFRGHGDSAWDDKACYSHEQLCQDTLLLIQQLPFKHWHIIGHSLGARIAMLMLARHSEISAASFTIIDTGPEVRAIGVNKVRQDAENAPTQFLNTQHYFDYLSSIYLLGQPDRLKRMAEFGLKHKDTGYHSKTDPAFTRALWKPDSQLQTSDDLRYPLNDELWQALTQLPCPTLILRGQASAILARNTAEKMLQTIPNATLCTISRAGHALMVDNPAEFEQNLLNFLNHLEA